MSTHEYVTLELCGQWIGIAVENVRDVLKTPAITPVAGAPGWIRGVINLRGSIVTAIDLKAWLGLPQDSGAAAISVITEYNAEYYTLLVDRAGDVIRIDPTQTLTNPPTLNARWQELSSGVQPYKSGLLILVDLQTILGWALAVAA
jgi:purine-binding chemotaxis protein CheW